MRMQKRKVPRKIRPPAFKTGLNHCRQMSIPVWSPWLTISQILMETNVFASALSFCESGWKLFSLEEILLRNREIEQHKLCLLSRTLFNQISSNIHHYRAKSRG